MSTPKQYVPAAAYVARKTKPRAKYPARPAKRAQPDQTALNGYEWPFPESAVRGRLVRNQYVPALARAKHLVPAALALLFLA